MLPRLFVLLALAPFAPSAAAHAADPIAATADPPAEEVSDPALLGHTPAEIASDPSVLKEICGVIAGQAAAAVAPPDPADGPADDDPQTVVRAASVPFDVNATCAALAKADAKSEAAATTAAAGKTSAAANAASSAARQTIKSILASGRVSTGSFTVEAPGSLRQEVRLRVPGRKGHKARSVLVGRLTRTARASGAVELTVKLTRAGRHALRGSTKGVTFTVKTTAPRRGGSGTATRSAKLTVALA